MAETKEEYERGRAELIRAACNAGYSGFTPEKQDQLMDQLAASWTTLRAEGEDTNEGDRAMNRRDGTANSGFVDFPTYLVNSNEGGMWVVAVCKLDPNKTQSAMATLPFLNHPNSFCGTDTIPNYDVVDSEGNQSFPLEKSWWFEVRWHSEDGDARYSNTTQRLSCAVLMGNSSGSWRYPDGAPWRCTVKDLTKEGKRLVKLLSQLCGEPVTLMTFLDT